ncbi:ubiquitin carboxyl-terminal hydrolase 42-like, partial [Sesbania bispinosa]
NVIDNNILPPICSGTFSDLCGRSSICAERDDRLRSARRSPICVGVLRSVQNVMIGSDLQGVLRSVWRREERRVTCVRRGRREERRVICVWRRKERNGVEEEEERREAVGEEKREERFLLCLKSVEGERVWFVHFALFEEGEREGSKLYSWLFHMNNRSVTWHLWCKPFGFSLLEKD